MGPILFLLPLATFSVLLLHFLGRASDYPADADVPWRKAFLLAAIFWGSFIALSSEILSLFSLINRSSLAVTWALALVGILSYAWSRGSVSRGYGQLRKLRLPAGLAERILLGGVVTLFMMLLLVAWIAPPNNVDSLLYHMSRIMHWAQNGNLEHYATGYHNQLFMPPWAELTNLHLRILWGSDRPANLVQWFSMVGSVVIASGVGELLGLRRKGQLLTGVFVASIPMGILQATSTQNDYIAAFWAVCSAYLVTLSFSRRLSPLEIAALSLSLGLGIMTKVTFFVYGFPIGVTYLLVELRKRGMRRALTSGAAIAGFIALTNAGVWVRNFHTYGGPYGTIDLMNSALAPTRLIERSKTDDSSSSGTDQNLTANPDAIEFSKRLAQIALWPISRISQAASLNLVTPSFAINHLAWSVLDEFPLLFNGVVSGSLMNAAWNHEDTAGNPLHLFLALLSVPLVAVGFRGHQSGGRIWGYSLMAGSTFLLLPLVIDRGSSGFGIRYQLPFFVLWAPIVGAATQTIRSRALMTGLGFALLMFAIPYALLNNTRPIIGRPPWPTRTRSVFVASSSEIIFASNPGIRRQYQELISELNVSGCRDIGLRIDSGDLEYLFWWLLGAPQSGHRIESIYVLQSLEQYLDPTFKPCAIICTICGNQQRMHNLVLHMADSQVSLYLGPDYRYEDDS